MKRVLTISPKTRAEINNEPQAKLKVCAYCRVSSASDEQMASYEVQRQYYTNYIQQNPEWEFAGIYADGGVSGTRKEGRAEFNRMLRDAETGQINLIITKSISRFARNTVDCLDAVRYLKDLGVAVYFERENINTISAESELLLSVLASIAEEESRAISSNLRWSYQKRFQRGKVVIVTNRFLGYDMNNNGELVINEPEAEIVRRIFREYIFGKSMRQIARGLQKRNIRTITGLSHWAESTIRSILTNEKYCGDAVLQKTFVVDHLTHRRKRNEGELPIYRVSGNHQAIVSKEDFEQVRRLLEERATEYGNLPENRDKYAKQYAFSGKLICGHCGASFKRRTWNSKEKSKQIVWQCSTYIKEGKSACSMKAVDDITLKAVFVRAFNKFYKNRDPMMRQFMSNVNKTLSCISSNGQLKNIEAAIDKITGQMKELIRRQLKEHVEDFQSEYGILQGQLEALRNQKDSSGVDKNKLEEIKARTQAITAFLDGQACALMEYDEDIFSALVERVKVLEPTHLVFELKNGLAIEQKFIKNKGINGLQ